MNIIAGENLSDREESENGRRISKGDGAVQGKGERGRKRALREKRITGWVHGSL